MKLTTHSQFGQRVSNRLWSDRPNTAKCQRERNGEKRTVFRKAKKTTSDKNNDKSLPVSKKLEDSQINWLGQLKACKSLGFMRDFSTKTHL